VLALRQVERPPPQLDHMIRFAEAHGCRMLQPVRHFGDRERSLRAVVVVAEIRPAMTVRGWKSGSAGRGVSFQAGYR
jgi:hypothetical protein